MESTTYGGFAPTQWMHALPATCLTEVVLGANQARTGGELRPHTLAPMSSAQGTTLPVGTPDAIAVKVRFVPFDHGSHAYEPTG